ncbi:dimethylarginine dimethylaminohydrolase family protein [Sphingobacterium kyonggiense]
MLKLQVNNESDRLHSVILGTATRNGPIPQANEAYDPKSLEHILQGTYPQEADMVNELNAFENVLKRYAVQVYRPEIIEDLNQIFTRDIGFVIEDKFIKSNILPDRAEEWNAIQYLIKEIPADKLITAPEDIHMEGGDVLLWNDHIFVGTYKGDDYASYNTARTNMKGVEFIRDLFPKKEVKEFNLIKSMTNPRANALHLDCCFQPVGKDKAIVFPGGFIDQEDYQYLEDLFGLENLFQITADEMYQMFSNVFSIAPDVVVSEKQFTRLNNWLREQGFTVEEIPYHEIGKQEGLLRCSTLPLMRG